MSYLASGCTVCRRRAVALSSGSRRVRERRTFRLSGKSSHWASLPSVRWLWPVAKTMGVLRAGSTRCFFHWEPRYSGLYNGRIRVGCEFRLVTVRTLDRCVASVSVDLCSPRSQHMTAKKSREPWYRLRTETVIDQV
jgi:hypothetical protein